MTLDERRIRYILLGCLCTVLRTLYNDYKDHQSKLELTAVIMQSITLWASVVDALSTRFEHVTYTHCQGKEILTSSSAATQSRMVWVFLCVSSLLLQLYLEQASLVSIEILFAIALEFTPVHSNHNAHVVLTSVCIFFAVVNKLVYRHPVLKTSRVIHGISCFAMVVSFIMHNAYICGDYTYSTFCFFELIFLQTNVYWNFKRRTLWNIKVRSN